MRVMIVKIMKTKNCHVQKELVKVGETQEVHEVDSSLQIQGGTYQKERICDFSSGAGWCNWSSSKILS